MGTSDKYTRNPRPLPPSKVPAADATPATHPIVASSGLEREGRFLVIEKLVNGVQRMSQQAGQLEAAESLSKAAMREALEASRVTFVPAHLVGIYHWYVPGINTIHLLLCNTGKRRIPSGRSPAPPDRHILAVRWLPPRSWFVGRTSIAARSSCWSSATTLRAVATPSTLSRASSPQC